MQGVAILAAIAFSIVAVGYSVIMLVWHVCRIRSFPKIEWSLEFDSTAVNQARYIAYSSALLQFLISMALATGAMLGAMDTALEITLGPNAQDDFDMSRWMLRAAIPAFCFGLFAMGSGGFFGPLVQRQRAYDRSMIVIPPSIDALVPYRENKHVPFVSRKADATGAAASSRSASSK